MSLVVRDGTGFVPAPTTRLQVGDRLVIVAASRVRRDTERRLRAVGRAGKLAHWHGERGD
jgi:cell volume regulation protein A